MLAPLLAIAPNTGAAQAIPAVPAPVRYSIRMGDAVVFGAAGLVGAVPTLAGTRLPYARCAPCDSTRLWPLDRRTIGLPREGVSMGSTLVMGATFAGAGALIALSRRGEPAAGTAAWEDLAILAEAVEIDELATQWAKVLFHRARPVLYTSAASQNPTVDAGRSFPSGHASFAFASAAAAASILQRRHELGRHKVEVVLLFAGATATSVLRVAAHKHFPTDVVAGAVLGTAVGWVLPQLHHVH